MVMAIGGGELQGELVVGIEVAAAGLVAAEECVGAGGDDVRAGRRVAAPAVDGAVHRCEDVALGGAGFREAARLVERGVGKLRCAAYVSELRRALDHAQAAYEFRGVGEHAEALERSREPQAVPSGETIGLPLDAEPFPLAALRGQDLAQLLA